MTIQATTFYTAAAAIFITTNLILGQETKTNPEVTIPTPDQQSIPNPSSDHLEIDPLPSKIFEKPLIEFLSPDIFSQTDPLDYFLTIASKLSYDQIQKASRNVKYNLRVRKFPQSYIPYAELLSSLLSQLITLRFVKASVLGTGKLVGRNQPPLFPENLSPDPQFLSLFSSDIFSDTMPPSIVLHKLLEIPQTKIPSLRKWLQKDLISENYSTQRYYWYIQCLLAYFGRNGKANLQTLRQLVEKHRGILTFDSSDSGQKGSTEV